MLHHYKSKANLAWTKNKQTSTRPQLLVSSTFPIWPKRPFYIYTHLDEYQIRTHAPHFTILKDVSIRMELIKHSVLTTFL